MRQIFLLAAAPQTAAVVLVARKYFLNALKRQVRSSAPFNGYGPQDQVL